jgi:hypothetical protein
MTSLSQSTNHLANFRSSQSSVEVVAALGEDDFRHARAAIPDFAQNLDYEDWLDDRYGLTVGLCCSGVDARIVTVDLSTFLAWCRSARLAPTEKNLRLFAGVVAVLRDRSIGQVEATILAAVSEREFASYFDLVDAFRAAGDYANWMTGRDASVRAAQAAGKIVFQTPTAIGLFLEWTRCLSQSSCETFLDRYAALTLEALAGE